MFVDQSSSDSAWDAFQEALFRALGSQAGILANRLVVGIIALLIIFLLWGLLWERLIAKAGFIGRMYWLLFGLFFVPMVIGSAAAAKFGSDANVMEFFSAVFGISTYVGLLILAFFPWPVHRKLRQFKK